MIYRLAREKINRKLEVTWNWIHIRDDNEYIQKIGSQLIFLTQYQGKKMENQNEKKWTSEKYINSYLIQECYMDKKGKKPFNRRKIELSLRQT
jgi:hypothetical protein